MKLREALSNYTDDYELIIKDSFGQVYSYVEIGDVEDDLLDCEVDEVFTYKDRYCIDLKMHGADTDFIKLKNRYPETFRDCHSEKQIKDRIADLTESADETIMDSDTGEPPFTGWKILRIGQDEIKVFMEIYLYDYDEESGSYEGESTNFIAWE